MLRYNKWPRKRNEKGHYARDCEKKEKEHLHVNIGDSSDEESNGVEHIFHQNINGVLSNTWILMENQRTVNQFINPKYLSNIKTVPAMLGEHLQTSKECSSP